MPPHRSRCPKCGRKAVLVRNLADVEVCPACKDDLTELTTAYLVTGSLAGAVTSSFWAGKLRGLRRRS